MKITMVICVSATTVCLLALVTVIILTDRDVAPFLIALAAVPAAVGTLFGVNSLVRDMGVVKKNTNGNLSEMTDAYKREKAEKELLLKILTPAQVKKVEDKQNAESA